jgi:hypothetical protein
MAQKRMFDKGLIETDAFMDMPMPTKALYFLLGMEADDEGFVSPNRVMRIYGGNADDLKVLIAKGFVIQFESGVVVITDWKKNNWLDSRRIKETVHQAEKKLLGESKEKYHLLSNGLADAKREESRGEEKSIEEKSGERPQGKPETSISWLGTFNEKDEFVCGIPSETLKAFADKYKAGEAQIRGKAEDLVVWCKTNGRVKKNYKLFLQNILKKEFGIRTAEDKILQERIDATVGKSSPFAKSLAEKMRM